MIFGGIEHFAIASHNTKHLADWYVSNLEFKIIYDQDGAYFIEAANGAVIEIIPAVGQRSISEIKSPGIRHIAIAVEQFETAYQHLQAKGVMFLGEPYKSQNNRLVFFSDADGNILHLIQRGAKLK